MLSLAEVRELRAIYLVSNTPLYLYRHLRRSPTVQRMGDNHSAAELAAFIAKVDGKARRSPTGVALAYGCAVAITYRAPAEADAAIGALAVQQLQWLPLLFSIWKQGRIGNSVMTETLPRIETPSRIAVSSSETKIVLPGGA